MLLDVYILFGFIYSIKGTSFKVFNEQNVWNSQFDCGIGYEMAGKNAFNNCQPETCKKIRLDKLTRNRINDTYWINGYALTSPIIEHLGCFEMRSTDIGAYMTTIPNNDVLMCSLFCKGRGFNTNSVIMLKEDACSCLPYSNLIEKTNRSDRCSKQCPGDNTDTCGGSHYFSLYNITENNIRGRDHSCICENLQNKAIEECKTCPEDLLFLCYNISEKEKSKQIEINCSQIPLTWRQELRTCLKSGASFQIVKRSGESCYITVAVDHHDFQYRFVKLLFVWNTRPESKYDYKCLQLRLEDKKEFKLLPINCSEKRMTLCHEVSNKVSTEDLDDLWTQHTTSQSTSYTTVINVSEVNHTWDRAYDSCFDGWTLSGQRMFNSCRSETCLTISAKEKLPNVKKKPHFLWVDGYVVQSPVMEYYECMKFTNVNNTASVLPHKKKMIINGVEKCSLFCQQEGQLNEKDLILLQNETCYCLPEETKKQWNKINVIAKKSTKDCDIRCGDDIYDRCGGKTFVFSAYKRKGLKMSAEIGGNCFSTSGRGTQVTRTKCKEALKFKCEEVNQTDGKRNIKVNCYDLMLNWYDARRTCNQSGRYIKLLNDKCDTNEDFKANKLWHNTFIKERIVWNTSIVNYMEMNNGYSCLGMKLTQDSYYILTAQNCNNKYYSLCQKDVSGQNIDGTQTFTSVSSIDQSTIDSISQSKEQDTEDSQNAQVSMYVGIAVALTILLMLVIVLAVYIRRRKRYKAENGPAAHNVYYSTVTGDQIQENRSHTLDGANTDQSNANLMSTTINTFTDYVQQDIHKKGTIYDQTGLQDSNEYDVSSTCKKYSPKVEEDICYYDHSRDAHTMYDTTDTKGLIHRNEMSQIYDHTREINDAYDVSHAYRQHDKTVNESVYTQSDF